MGYYKIQEQTDFESKKIEMDNIIIELKRALANTHNIQEQVCFLCYFKYGFSIITSKVAH